MHAVNFQNSNDVIVYACFRVNEEQVSAIIQANRASANPGLSNEAYVDDMLARGEYKAVLQVI